MNDDELLAAAHGAVQANDPLADPRWDAFARGELPPGEEASLQAHPVAHGAFAPIPFVHDGAAGRAGAPSAPNPFRDEVLDRILAGLPEKKAKVIPLRRLRAAVGVVSALAVAALVLLLVRPGRPEALPMFEMSIHGEAGQRGEPPAPEPVRLGPGSRVEVVLRPATPVYSLFVARVFLVRDGHARLLRAPLAVSGEGSVRLAGSFEEVFANAPPGAAEIVAAVGPEKAVPDGEGALESVLRGDSHPEGLQLARAKILIVPRE